MNLQSENLSDMFYRDSQLVNILIQGNESNKVDFIGINGDTEEIELDVYRWVALDYVKDVYKYKVKESSLELRKTEFVYPNCNELIGVYTEIIKG